MRNHKGLTFLEILVAVFILTIALLGFFQLFNMALNASHRATREIIATNLGRGLMAEIMSKHFEEPSFTGPPPPPALGPDGAEGCRTGCAQPYDDVDDYNAFHPTTGTPENPPFTIGGLAMDGTGGRPNFSNFTRNVEVQYCDIDASNTVVPQGATYNPDYHKLIRVTVTAPRLRDVVIDEVKAREE